MLVYFINFYNLHELINEKYNLNIETITDNMDKTQQLLEQPLQKFDALNEKLIRIEDNLNAQIWDIKDCETSKSKLIRLLWTTSITKSANQPTRIGY